MFGKKKRLVPMAVFGCIFSLCVMQMLCACDGSKKENMRGTVSRMESDASINTYTNEWIGIGCEFGNDCVFLSDEDIAKMGGTKVAPKELSEAEVEEQAMFCDMTVQSQEEACVTMVTIQRVSAGEKAMPLEKYVEQEVKNGLAQYIGDSYDIESMTQTTLNCAGADRPAVTIMINSNGITAEMVIVFFKCKGNCIAMVTSTSLDQEANEKMLKAFHTLN